MNPARNIKLLTVYLAGIAAGFLPTRQERRRTVWAAEDGQTVAFDTTPMEEFILASMVYGVEVALKTVPDRKPKPPGGSLFDRFGSHRKPFGGDDLPPMPTNG
jgi:hypothetical protein